MIDNLKSNFLRELNGFLWQRLRTQPNRAFVLASRPPVLPVRSANKLAAEQVEAQKQIFALNASIEAARARDAGRGFSVVAEEVKKFASKTNEATKQVSELMTISMDAIGNG